MCPLKFKEEEDEKNIVTSQGQGIEVGSAYYNISKSLKKLHKWIVEK